MGKEVTLPLGHPDAGVPKFECRLVRGHAGLP